MKSFPNFKVVDNFTFRKLFGHRDGILFQWGLYKLYTSFQLEESCLFIPKNVKEVFIGVKHCCEVFCDVCNKWSSSLWCSIAWERHVHHVCPSTILKLLTPLTSWWSHLLNYLDIKMASCFSVVFTSCTLLSAWKRAVWFIPKDVGEFFIGVEHCYEVRCNMKVVFFPVVLNCLETSLIVPRSPRVFTSDTSVL